MTSWNGNDSLITDTLWGESTGDHWVFPEKVHYVDGIYIC